MKWQSSIGLVLVLGVLVAYPLLLKHETNKVDDFCAAMRPGLQVRKIPAIAQELGVEPRYLHVANAVTRSHRGYKPSNTNNDRVLVVVAPMTVGEYVCGVHYNDKVVLRADLNR